MTPPVTAAVVSRWAGQIPDLLPGLWLTLRLTGASLVLGLPLGVLLAVAVSSRRRRLRWPAIAVVEIGRGAPALVLLYVVYYGLPQTGVTLPAFTAATLALGFATGAYSSEIFRAGLLAVPAGQREAARALGLRPRAEFRHVVFPQALGMVIPPIVGFAVVLYQATSLAYAIALPELLSRAYNIATITFQFTSALALAGLVYATVSIATTRLVRTAEAGRAGSRPRPARSLSRLVVVVTAALTSAACGGSGGSPVAAGLDAGCTPRHRFKTITPGQLTVVAWVSPPYTTEDGDGRIGGIDGEILARIAAMECLDIRGTGVSASAFVPLLQTGRADVAIGGIYATPQRGRAVDLSDTVWVDGMSFVSKVPLTRIAELPGHKVGTVQGYLWNEDLGKVLGEDVLRLYQTVPALVSDIENGRIDVGVLGTAEAVLRVRQRSGSGLGANPVVPDSRVASSTAPGRIVFPHTKGNAALTAALNEDIAALRRDGTIGRILAHHGLAEPPGRVG